MSVSAKVGLTAPKAASLLQLSMYYLYAPASIEAPFDLLLYLIKASQKMNDLRPEVRDAAREAHRIKFPHHEHNIIKKGLTARSLEFYLKGYVWNEWDDEISVHMRFFVDNRLPRT